MPGTGRRSLQQGGDGGLPGALIGVVNSSSSWFAAEPNAPAGFTEGTAGYQMVGRSYDGMVSTPQRAVSVCFVLVAPQRDLLPAPHGANKKSFPRGAPMQHLAPRRNQRG